MAKRSSSKPLYELMVGERNRSAGAPVHPPAADDDGDSVDLGSEPGRLAGVLSAGRSIRVPVGFLVLIVPSVLVLVVLAYMFGASRGEQRAQADADRLLRELADGDPAWTARDPLANDPSGRGGGESNPAARDSQSRAESARGGAAGGSGPRRGDRPEAGAGAAGRGGPGDNGDTPAGADSTGGSSAPATGDGDKPDSQRWAAIESDPRESGRYYLILAETRQEGARRLAAYLRENELEAYIVPGHNPGLRRVIVRPGFESGSESDPDVARLREAVHRVGRAWKALYPVESDLSDAYLAPG